MKGFYAAFFILLFLMADFCYGANITATLDSDNGDSGFAFNDSTSATMALIDSDGNLQLKGGLRLDSGGVKCETSEMLIIDGMIGVNTTDPGYGITASDVSEWNFATLSSSATATHRNHYLTQRSNAGGALTTGFNLGGMAMGGYNGTGWTRGWNGGAEISAIATEDWDAASNGTKILFRVNKNGTAGPFDALTIDQDGSLNSPMWRVTHVMDAVAGGMPKTSGNFTTGGGSLILIASGSGYRHPVQGSGQIGMNVQVDGVTKGICKSFSNETGSHRAFTTNPIVVSGIAAGTTHTITVTSWNSTYSDGNDFYNVTVLELPF